MKKKKIFNLLIILSILSILNISCPQTQANVWITPMKMLAESDVKNDEIIYIQKFISLRNDENKSIIIHLNSTDISVIFENETFELLPFETKYIYPLVGVQKGENTGDIYIKATEQTDDENTSGSKVVTSLAISVTAIGTLNVTSNSNENTIYSTILDNGYFYGLIILIISGIIIFVFIFYKKNIKSELTEIKIKCPSCKKINIVKGEKGNKKSVKCSKCGKKGKITFE